MTGGAQNLDPVPVSPLPPSCSHEIEKERALRCTHSIASGAAVKPSDILYEDAHFVIVDKRKVRYCEHVLESVALLFRNSGSESLKAESTLRNAKSCQKEIPVSSTEEHKDSFYLVHRLDRDTTGLIMVALTSHAAAKLNKLFSSRQVEKYYLAVCQGKMPLWQERVIQTGHGRSRNGIWRVYDQSDIGKTLPGGSKVRDMITKMEVLRKIDPSDVLVRPLNNERDCIGSGKDLILVKAIPVTGRTHQIRLHCQHLGLPIIGDVRYGGCRYWNYRENEIQDSHALHSSYLHFRHPFNDEVVEIVSKPEWAES